MTKLGMVEDVTETKRMDEQLRQAQKMEAVGQLTSGVAHDFNNILTAVIGNLELLQEQLAGDSELRPFAELALQASQRGAGLIDRLLSFSRKQILDPVLTEMNTTAEQFLQLARQALTEEVEINMQLASNLWPVVVDPAQLESALLNLAFNARDAMAGGGELLLTTANFTVDAANAVEHENVAPGDYATISMSDNGSGMSKEALDRAFDPFFTTKNVGEGTGLGLSMVYGFVRQSGGRVTIDSLSGKGTTVRIYLPRAEIPGTNNGINKSVPRRISPVAARPYPSSRTYAI